METREITYDNEWRVELIPGNLTDGGLYDVGFRLYRRNGYEWQLEIRGQVKREGCSNWGYGDKVILHGCGRKDMEVFAWVYDQVKALFGDDWDGD